MTFLTDAAAVLLGAGLVIAVVVCVVALRALASVRKAPHPTVGEPAPSDPADDVPTMRFKGETFEARWQGSRGYERPEARTLADGENWTDRLVIPVVTPLRPSRFSDPSYWTRYLPGLVLIVLVVPLALLALGQLLAGGTGRFAPSAAQLGVPTRNSDYLNDPGPCHLPASGLPNGLHTTSITDADNGRVFWVHSGDLVAITYDYGKPVFSRDVPLCDPGTTAGDSSRVAEYQVSGSGTGSICIPQPTGTIVAEIDVSHGPPGLAYFLLGLTVVVLCADVVVVRRLRRATRERPSRV